MSQPEPKSPAGTGYVGNIRTRVYHLFDCPLCAIASRDTQLGFDTVMDAVREEYTACDYCLPDLKHLDGTGQAQSGIMTVSTGGSWLRSPLVYLAVLLIVAAAAVTYLAGETVSKAERQGASQGTTQGYANGRQQGQQAATSAGYEAGYQEGDQAGYNDGLARGASEGKTTGNAEGYPQGNDDGIAEGYLQGKTEGWAAGKLAGRTVGAETGYDNGYAIGFEAGVGANYLIRNPTYSEVRDLLRESTAVTAQEINAEFEAQGIRTGFVWLHLGMGGGAGFSFAAFDTVDNGVIIVDPWSHVEIVPEIGQRVSTLLGDPVPDYDDTITRVRIAW